MEERESGFPEGGFQNAADFAAWLESLDHAQQLAFGPVLAARAALRALPSTGRLFSLVAADEASRAVLSAFRALQLFLSAYREPPEKFHDAASNAYVAARNAAEKASSVNSFAAAALNAAASVAQALLANSGRELVAAVQAAVFLAANSFKDQQTFWHTLTVDANTMITAGEGLVRMDRMLWLSEPPADWSLDYSAFTSALRRTTAETNSRDSWQVWLDWFDAKIPGSAPWKLDRRVSHQIEMDIALGGRDPDFWNRSADEINAEIAGWLREAGWRSKTGEQASAIANPQKRPRKKVQKTAATSTDAAANDDALEVILTESDVTPQLNESAAEAPAANAGVPPPGHRADLEPLSDAVNSEVDYLDRAKVAYALAGRLNEVWDQMNGARGTPSSTPGGMRASQASPGFVVHIDAPWGGGKSTFAEYVAKILNPYAIEGKLPDWLKALPLGDEKSWRKSFRRPWHVVRFNAWQHQHISPPWWVFYESIRHACVTQNTGETNRRAAEEFPLPDVHFAFATEPVRWFRRAAFWLTERAWRLFSPGFIANVSVALGTIALLLVLSYSGLIRLEPGAVTAGNGASQTPLISSVILLLLGGGAAVWKFVSAFANSLILGTADAAKNYSLGAGDPLKRMRAHFAALMESIHNPVLVIVDDLDRCDPAFVVELVRGMQTILVSPRVVYLLLGDRDWIEQSFTEVHKAMKGIEVGPEHRFGGRFVEKAIQFSMVLPDIAEGNRKDYVRQLLLPAAALTAAETVPAEPPMLDMLSRPDTSDVETLALRAEIESVLNTDSYLAREEKAAEISKKITGVDAVKKATPAELQLQQEMATKLFYIAVSDKSAAEGTSHMLEGLVPALPANPRQIKRIINTLSLLQQITRLKYPDKGPKSNDWQFLARWVVLMVEWPVSWFTLTRYPRLATLAIACADGRPDAEIEASIKSGLLDHELPKDGGLGFARAIAANKPVMNLLKFVGDEWTAGPLTHHEIRWLREIMPATSGQLLQVGQVEKPSSEAPAKPLTVKAA
ncbi:MAG: P-loop NTPase fold protein [Rhizobiaceae bacterium]